MGNNNLAQQSTTNSIAPRSSEKVMVNNTEMPNSPQKIVEKEIKKLKEGRKLEWIHSVRPEDHALWEASEHTSPTKAIRATIIMKKSSGSSPLQARELVTGLGWWVSTGMSPHAQVTEARYIKHQKPALVAFTIMTGKFEGAAKRASWSCGNDW